MCWEKKEGRAGLLYLRPLLPPTPTCVGVLPWLWQTHQGHGADTWSPPLRVRKTSRLRVLLNPFYRRAKEATGATPAPASHTWTEVIFPSLCSRAVELLLQGCLFLSGFPSGTSGLPGGGWGNLGHLVGFIPCFLPYHHLHQGMDQDMNLFPPSCVWHTLPWESSSPGEGAAP